MIRKISTLWANKMVRLGNQETINVPVLVYGCELIITTIVGLFILAGVSILTGHPLAWLFFVAAFAPHRTTAGGYHAGTHLWCNIVTSSMLFLSIVMSYCGNWNSCSYILISLYSAFLVLLLAPVTASNKPLSIRRYRRNRIKAIIVVSINCSIAVIFTMLSIVCEEANLYFSGVFFAAASLVMGKIKTNIKGEKSNEN